jgi:hypothetical protein
MSIALRSRSERRSPRRPSSAIFASRSRRRSCWLLTGRLGGGTNHPLTDCPPNASPIASPIETNTSHQGDHWPSTGATHSRSRFTREQPAAVARACPSGYSCSSGAGIWRDAREKPPFMDCGTLSRPPNDSGVSARRTRSRQSQTPGSGSDRRSPPGGRRRQPCRSSAVRPGGIRPPSPARAASS